jgi:AcrR family transcriptional regulator
MQRIDARELLSRTMFELMSKKTIDRISVREILQGSDVSRATFYRNFKDKFDLMHFCYQATVDRFLVNIKSDNWKEILIDIFTFFKENQSFFINAIKTDGDDSFLRFLYDYSFCFYERQMLQRLHTDLLTREDLDCVAFNCSGSVWLVEIWARRNMQESPVEMAERTYRFMPLRLQKIFDG